MKRFKLAGVDGGSLSLHFLHQPKAPTVACQSALSRYGFNMYGVLMHVKPAVMKGRTRELLRHRLIIPLLMRLFLLTLMIVLLPLRSWVGDVMAMQTSVPEQPVATVMSVHDNCHEMQQHGMYEPSVEVDTAHAEEDCGSCTACEICHSLALAAALLPAPAAPARLPQPSALTRLHASADPHPGFKPPIAGA